jgi:CMP-N,N'-diacetyllegionaminic acid synthase
MAQSQPSIVALIPARSGSKRLKGKNIMPFHGHPLIAYTIAAARESQIFSRVLVSTESEDIAEVARSYGAEVPFLRPAEFAADHSPDIEWLRHLLQSLKKDNGCPDTFALLRPTSPFRQGETIRRAWRTFLQHPEADSLRAVEPCQQHPGKMWQLEGPFLKPLLNDGGADPPWHSSATQSLPPVYAQNASLEMAWSKTPLEKGTIAGDKLVAFQTEGYEGYDINRPEDLWLAEILIDKQLAQLPPIQD